MREILFRGKRTDNGTWAYGYLFCIWERAYLCWGTTNSVPNMKEVLHETVGQYTGLRDKNGRKIFEGDIVKMRAYGVGYHCTSVYFRDGKFAVDGTQYHFKNICSNSVEVIGNIYDNPELLEGGIDNG